MFDTKGIRVQHKSDRGYVDFEFSNMINYYNSFSEYVSNLMDDDMSIVKTGKSLLIRLNVPIIDFHKEFSNFISEIHMVLALVSRFYNMYSKLDIDYINNIKIKNRK